MILVFAAPIGPCGSRTPPEQPARKTSGTSAPAIPGDSVRRFEGRKTVDQYIDEGTASVAVSDVREWAAAKRYSAKFCSNGAARRHDRGRELERVPIKSRRLAESVRSCPCRLFPEPSNLSPVEP